MTPEMGGICANHARKNCWNYAGRHEVKEPFSHYTSDTYVLRALQLLPVPGAQSGRLRLIFNIPRRAQGGMPPWPVVAVGAKKKKKSDFRQFHVGFWNDWPEFEAYLHKNCSD